MMCKQIVIVGKFEKMAFCSDSSDCQEHKDDPVFCNFDASDYGGCEYCSLRDDGCKSTGLVTQKGAEECKKICKKGSGVIYSFYVITSGKWNVNYISSYPHQCYMCHERLFKAT